MTTVRAYTAASDCYDPTRQLVLGRAPVFSPDQDLYTPGTTVTFSCSDQNDELFGPPSAKCQDDGSWSLYAPNCLLACDDPGTPIGGSQVGNPTYSSYTDVQFQCDVTADVTPPTLVGADTITCVDGQWSGDVPLCYSSCPDPGVPNYGSLVTAAPTFAHGETLQYSCENGYQLTGSDIIACNDGNWSGPIPQCNDINECYSLPCQNNGVCNDEINMYTCTCMAGYQGINCETDIDECASSPCMNGAACTSPSNMVDLYVCTCADGWQGTNCEIEVNECASNPCQNAGTCNDHINEYTCDCLAGYEGTRCQTGQSYAFMNNL
uniref:Fibropellin-1-like n=1 Tax=Saccoglossus kowalevskii TaxID=10224 RepID=A0ABM0M4K8_SACKO|nr:PREDICTED: fibropellin-1-like [Saccoglossus kowalevskii]